MQEKTFKEQIFEEFDKISFPTETDYGCDGANDNCCGCCGGEYVDEFGTRVIIKDFISEALDRQREEFMKCLPKEIINDNDIRLGNSRPHNERLIGKKLFNSCRNRFLENLKKSNLI